MRSFLSLSLSSFIIIIKQQNSFDQKDEMR